ncbi:hypothetical protein OC846_000871 [Tilletia horrida]|uniref:Cytochrome c oxidase subunit 6B-like protein new16 n=1 Tax=Tilletia horrida TaxID=155126 RepID=A0AAN6GZZ8_9BASI|nr:hypothetical protein OC845_001174 [Tilletia horrida]KAK0556844.1 hypothetical protein OC846_000871 [Tilletia horrida]KAK0569220.1 hypothetical protein OC861_001146 [Tilletia horrida]
MGLFSSSSSSSSSPPAAPTRAERQQCWDHRDTYFACLTQHNIAIPPGTDTSDGRGPPSQSAKEVEQARKEDPCKKERDGFEKHCAKSWADYFRKRRVLEERQRLMYAKDGAGQNTAPAPSR